MVWIVGIVFQVKKLQLKERNPPAQAHPMRRMSPRLVGPQIRVLERVYIYTLFPELAVCLG